MPNTMEQDVEKILYSQDDIAAQVARLGKEISRDYEGKNLMLVGILKGANIFTADLARAITEKIQLEFMVVSSYGIGSESSGEVKIVKDIKGDLTGKDILLVEAIVDTGLTLSFLKKYLSERGAASVKICTLLDKPERRKSDVHIDYVGYTVPNEFIIGYGIDYAEYYRNLPYIAALKREVYE